MAAVEGDAPRPRPRRQRVGSQGEIRGRNSEGGGRAPTQAPTGAVWCGCQKTNGLCARAAQRTCGGGVLWGVRWNWGPAPRCVRPPGPREPPASPTDADKGRWVRLWIATWHSAARDPWGAGSEPRRGESKYVTKWALITLGPLGASVSSVFRGK
jgi:hypothetical protein